MPATPGETRAVLILGARGLALYAAAAVLWHLPLESLWLRLPALAAAALLLCFALAATLVAVHGARNEFGRRIGVPNRSAWMHLLTLVFLLVAAIGWLAVYLLVGRVLGA